MKQKTIYVAEDGKEFQDLNACEIHDSNIYFGMRFFQDEKEINAYDLPFDKVVCVADYIVVTDSEEANRFFELAKGFWENVRFDGKTVSDGDVYYVIHNKDDMISFVDMAYHIREIDCYLMEVRDFYHQLREFCGIEEHLIEW